MKSLVITLFPVLVAGLLMGCASANDTITLDVAEVVTYEKEASAMQKEPNILLEIKLAGDPSFTFNSAQLTSTGTALLEQIAEELRSYPASPVMVVGHTCSMGDVNYNIDLSRRRAETVRNILQQQYGVTNPISIEGKGSSEPKVSNNTMEGRKTNRRVEIFILK